MFQKASKITAKYSYEAKKQTKKLYLLMLYSTKKGSINILIFSLDTQHNQGL